MKRENRVYTDIMGNYIERKTGERLDVKFMEFNGAHIIFLHGVTTGPAVVIRNDEQTVERRLADTLYRNR